MKGNPDGSKPKDALENYVKVTFKAGEGGTVSGDLVYYVSPEVEVDLTQSANDIKKTADVGYVVNGEKWTPKIKFEKITEEKTYVFNFDKSKDVVEKIDEHTKIPEGYVTVTFKTEDEAKGKVDGKDKKIYYVNPKADIKLVKLADGQTAGEKQLAVPKTAPAASYEFEGWYEDIDTEKAITSERIHVAKFKLAKVKLTYNAGGATGEVPKELEVDHGTSVRLARPDKLSKENATFAGWKLDGDETIYQPGDQVKLEKARTATAQWKTDKHTVTFDSKGGSDVASQSVEHGKTATNPDAPKLDGKVFMGWKEKETDTTYFDFNTPITADKTLIAIWQAPVQKIKDGDPVEEQFIKVTFKEGDHGKLKLADAEQTSPVIYKVAKDYSFDQAKEKGLVVPGIAPNKYYKAKDANSGWDKELKLEGKETTFTAQYEPMADVIPIDPKVTPDNKLQDDKPVGMVLVTFKVSDDNKFYIDKNVKYYVKKNMEVRIPTPVVLNKNIGDVFTGWKAVNVVNEPIEATTDPNAKKFEWVKQSFSTDTTISDENLVDPIIFITAPKAGAKIVYIETFKGEIGKLQVVGHDTIYENTTYTRRGKSYNVFRLDQALKTGDGIRYWAEDGGKASMVKENVIQ